MRRTILIISALMLVGAVAFGQSGAILSSVSGKVEVRPEGGSWQAAEQGRTLSQGTTISTGFGANAEVTIAQSRIEVEPLTRMTVQEIVETSDRVSSEVFVGVGRTEADVQSAEGVESEFTMNSPNTTASVRGTRFRFDTKHTEVTEGRVSVINAAGRSHSVSQGGSATVDQSGRVEGTRDNYRDNSSVNTSPGEGEDSGGGGEQQADTATVIVTIDWE